MKQNAVAEVRVQLDTMKEQFAAVLPKHIPIERFARVVMTAIQTTPELLNVDRRSLWNAAMKAAQDGLLPDGRLGAIVIYKDKRRGQIAQWLPMIAGVRQKVRNSGEVATFDAHVVHELDEFDYVLGDAPQIIHHPHKGADRGAIVAAYSIAVLRTGEISREVMWVDEIEKVRRQSRMPDGQAWTAHYGEMCKKTVAKRHAKVLPMSSDLDDLLRREDEDESGVGPAIQPPPGKRSMTDALNMLASLPESEAPEQVPESAGDDLIDVIDNVTGEVEQREDVSDGR